MNNDQFSQNEVLIGGAGKTKAAVAEFFNTSTRSIGRWMEKHGFDSFEETQKNATVSEVVEVVVESKAEEPVVVAEDTGGKATIRDQARMFFDAGSYAKLWEFKTKKKKSWLALGFTGHEENVIVANKPT